MESTVDNPLSFFEFFINEDNIKKRIEDIIYYYDFLSYELCLPTHINYIKEDSYNEYSKGILKIEEVLIPVLQEQFNKSKALLKEFVLNNSEIRNQNYLRIQFNTIQSILNYKHNLINSYPFFILPLRGLVNHINDKLLDPKNENYSLNESKLKFEPTLLNHHHLKTDIEIIKDVLGYMNGLNEKREVILESKEYNLLIEYTVILVETGELPSELISLKPKIGQDTLRFTYWVLHKELYTTSKIKPVFIDFLMNVFENFQGNKKYSVQSQFGTKSRVYKHDFLPSVIKKHL